MGKKKKKDTFRLNWASLLINKYFLVSACFLVWISFLDTHNLITQMKLKGIINQLKGEKQEFESLYLKAKDEKVALESNKEKYAREKYYMHKENEEVFIVK